MKGAKSAQGRAVSLELEELRVKQLANKQRSKLKDCEFSSCDLVDQIFNDTALTPHTSAAVSSPLTTPEEAQAFLASIRDKRHQKQISHQPPSHLSSDGVDAWYMQMKSREKELRQRRKEAEDILRGYRGTAEAAGFAPNGKDGRFSLDTPRSVFSENLQDPTFNLQEDVYKAGEGKYDEGRPPSTRSSADHRSNWSPSSSREEKKSEENNWGSKHLERRQQFPFSPPLDEPEAMQLQNSDEFVPETIWRDFIRSETGSRFPPEAGRYHLYVSYACPGSHRALIVRTLKGLEDVISVAYVHPVWRLTNPANLDDKHRGWVFGDPDGQDFSNTIGRGGPFPAAYRETEPDPEFNAYSIRELYERADDTSGKYTIPLIWDKKLKTIVNNESSDIAYMLNSCFNDFAEYPDLDLYTEDDEDGRVRLGEVSEWLSPLMIHGVYRCGFAKNQFAYDRAIHSLCVAYDRADDMLSRQRYLTGNTLTDADIRLFVTLLRFDEVYAIYFKANARLVMLTPSLLNFCREIYQLPGVAETCDMDQIKAHFFGSHAEWNKYSVIPRGLGFMELLEMPHDRDELDFDDE